MLVSVSEQVGLCAREIVEYTLDMFPARRCSKASITEHQDDLKSLTQAHSCKDWPDWQASMDHEITTLKEAGTWITVPKADGTIKKYKVCLITQGFMQKFGVDYFDTFSPITRLSSFCIILAIAAHNDWDTDTFDFNGAYLCSR
jgi:hypothetical protein